MPAARTARAWRRLITGLVRSVMAAQRRCGRHRGKTMTPALSSARRPRQAQHEHQDFGDRLVQLNGNLVTEFDIGEGAREYLVLLERKVVRLGDLDDLGADRALALGDDARGAGAVIMQRDRELV